MRAKLGLHCAAHDVVPALVPVGPPRMFAAAAVPASGACIAAQADRLLIQRVHKLLRLHIMLDRRPVPVIELESVPAKAGEPIEVFGLGAEVDGHRVSAGLRPRA